MSSYLKNISEFRKQYKKKRGVKLARGKRKYKR